MSTGTNEAYQSRAGRFPGHDIDLDYERRSLPPPPYEAKENVAATEAFYELVGAAKDEETEFDKTADTDMFRLGEVGLPPSRASGRSFDSARTDADNVIENPWPLPPAELDLDMEATPLDIEATPPPESPWPIPLEVSSGQNGAGEEEDAPYLQMIPSKTD